MQARSGSRSIATRLILVLGIGVSVLLGLASFGLSSYLSERLEQRSAETLIGTNHQIVAMIDAYNRALKGEIERLARVYASHYPSPLTLDATGRLWHKGVDVSEAGNAVADRFTSLTGASATLFARQGDRLVRVATSIRDENGARAIGSELSHGHPAYRRLLDGDGYTGKARLFGRDVMTRYVPITDPSGKVLGAFYAGLDFTEGMADVRDKVLSIAVGSTGYPFAIDAGVDRGRVVLHPAIEGKSLVGVRDAHGKDFINEMLDRREGTIRYWWQNPGEAAPREKISAFVTYPEWNWVIASGSYMNEFNAEATALVRWLAGGTVVVLLLMIVTLWWTSRRWIAQPLGQMVAVANQVADGDLTGRIDPMRDDEIGALGAAFSRMQEKLATLLTEIRANADEVSANAEQLRCASDGVAASSHAQSDALTSVAASVEEMSGSITQISDHAEQAQTIAMASVERAGTCTSTLDGSVAAMERIASAVSAISGTVSRLGEHSQAISGIVDTIREIADQTNLLALNAAIEAARAGEQGRGFAVVADEVRKLAERTTTSTQEIGNLIQAIQSETQKAVSAMSDGVGVVDHGVALTATATESVRLMREGAQTVRDAVAGISDAMVEQSKASHSVAGGVEKLAGKVESNSHEARNTASAAGQLQALAVRLHRQVEAFRI